MWVFVREAAIPSAWSWSDGIEAGRARGELRETLLRFPERANDVIQQILSFRYDFGDTFRKPMFPAEYVSECGVQNHRDIRTDVLELASRIDSVHARHGHIENNQIGPDSRCLVERVDSVAGFTTYVEPRELQLPANSCSNVGIVINDENRIRHAAPWKRGGHLMPIR
jgi:hypothetical protein